MKQLLTEYFGLNEWPIDEREQILQRISQILDQVLIARLIDQLNEAELDLLGEELGASDPPEPAKLFAFLSSRVSNVQMILVDEIISMKWSFEHQSLLHTDLNETPGEQLLNDAFEVGKDPVEHVTKMHGLLVDTGGLFLDLAYDPNHHLRTRLEKREWRVKKICVWLARLTVTLWFDVVLFIVLLSLHQHEILKIIPEWVRQLVPAWYAELAIGYQLLLTLTIPLLGLSLFFLVIFVAGRLPKPAPYETYTT